MNLLALDFGGSSVKCAVVAEEGVQVLDHFSVSSQADSYIEWLETFMPHFNRVNDSYGIDGIAISSCGAVNAESSVIHGSSALDYIHGQDIRALYQAYFAVPVEIENDANCAALAESWLGAGKGIDSFCLVVIGTGIGGAVVSNKHVLPGHQFHAGEFGFSVLDYDNGKPQIFGHLASTNALVEQAVKALGISQTKLNGIHVFELYDAGNPVIIRVVDAWSRYLALGLYNIQYHLDPQKIVLGGAISQRHDLVDLIESQLDDILSNLPFASVRPTIVQSMFGNDANLIGAVRHFLNRRTIVNKVNS